MYPWGDFHSLNLGWFLLQFKEWTEKIQEYLDNGGGTSENLANVIAPVFNAENSYLTGDYVLYNDELYKANQAVNPGTWNPNEWTRCLVTEEMGSGSGGVDNVARLMIAGQYSNTYNYQKYAICRYNDKLWMCNTNLPSGGEEWEPSHWDEITVGAALTGTRRSLESFSSAISTLNDAISDETTARENADTDLQDLIDGLTTAVNTLNAIIPLDSTPTNGSLKGVTSDGVYDAINNLVSSGTAVTNTTVCSGTCKWVLIAGILFLSIEDLAITEAINDNTTALFSGLPAIGTTKVFLAQQYNTATSKRFRYNAQKITAWYDSLPVSTNQYYALTAVIS